jgi:MarR family transcriptional regulator, organic hydroperoxide resistance regulator
MARFDGRRLALVGLRIAGAAPSSFTFQKLGLGCQACLDRIRYNDYRCCMAGRLQREIKQNKPFSSLEEEVLLNLARTADGLMRQVAAGLKAYGISPTQYNVLRILRGAGESGLACGDIADRMITRDPDITRLLDRLEKRDFIQRCRETKDRRVIMARITSRGLQLLEKLDAPNSELLHLALGHMSQSKLTSLSSLLEEVRCRKE